MQTQTGNLSVSPNALVSVKWRVQSASLFCLGIKYSECVLRYSKLASSGELLETSMLWLCPRPAARDVAESGEAHLLFQCEPGLSLGQEGWYWKPLCFALLGELNLQTRAFYTKVC